MSRFSADALMSQESLEDASCQCPMMSDTQLVSNTLIADEDEEEMLIKREKTRQKSDIVGKLQI